MNQHHFKEVKLFSSLTDLETLLPSWSAIMKDALVDSVIPKIVGSNTKMTLVYQKMHHILTLYSWLGSTDGIYIKRWPLLPPVQSRVEPSQQEIALLLLAVTWLLGVSQGRLLQLYVTVLSFNLLSPPVIAINLFVGVSSMSPKLYISIIITILFRNSISKIMYILQNLHMIILSPPDLIVKLAD